MLESSIQNSSSGKAFESMFGKERHGRIHCYRRKMTPSILKKKHEVAAVQKAADGKIDDIQKKIEELETTMNC